MLPSIPAKRYFTIGEVSELCGVKPYVLRYWEQEFAQLKPMKRRGNRRYYQRHEVLLVRRIRELLYAQGFTISGARNRLLDLVPAHSSEPEAALSELETHRLVAELAGQEFVAELPSSATDPAPAPGSEDVRRELLSIRDLLAMA
jgi:DNA-binding transcriptional MerR regulator